MNPINAINQEFTRNVIAEWSDAKTIRCQEQEVDEAYGGIAAAVRALVLWVRGCVGRQSAIIETTLGYKSTQR
jgi:hypothetical protein